MARLIWPEAAHRATMTGPPRLVTILPDGVLLNGVAQSAEALPEALTDLMETPSDTIVLRARHTADVQRLADVAAALTGAGFTRLVLAE